MILELCVVSIVQCSKQQEENPRQFVREPLDLRMKQEFIILLHERFSLIMSTLAFHFQVREACYQSQRH